MKHLKTFENVDFYQKVWLFPIKTLKTSIDKIPELKAGRIELIYELVKDFGKKGLNTKYVFVAAFYDENGHDTAYFDFCLKAFEWIEKDNLEYMGPVDIPQDEYELEITKLYANLYNL